MAYGLQIYESTGVLKLDTSVPVAKLISVTTVSIPASSNWVTRTYSAPGARNDGSTIALLVPTHPSSTWIAGTNENADLNSQGTDTITIRTWGNAFSLAIYILKP